jgi:hypothetical protein
MREAIQGFPIVMEVFFCVEKSVKFSQIYPFKKCKLLVQNTLNLSMLSGT